MTEMQELSDYFQTVLKEKKAELAKVKNQLAIAVEVLEDIEKAESSTSYMAYCALQQIKELEKDEKSTDIRRTPRGR